jgi:hypothetical protein
MKFAYIKNNEIISVAEFENEIVLQENKELFLRENNLDDIQKLSECNLPYKVEREIAEAEATRQALLDRLGITADEAKLLLN